MNTRQSLMTSLSVGLLFTSLQCLADTHSEGQWLHYLQQGHHEGMTMPNTHSSDNERLRLSRDDIKRFLGAQYLEQKASKLQFTKLNYQADVSEKSVEIRWYYQF